MKDQDKIYGIIGTLLFHGLIILLLLLYVFPNAELKKEEGVLVQFGNINEASGTFEPKHVDEKPVIEPVKPEPEPQPKPEVREEMIVQDQEETVALEQEKKKKEQQKKKEEADRLLVERKRKEEEDRKRKEQEAIAERTSNLAKGAFGTKDDKANRGTGTTGEGLQGVPTGNSNVGEMSGAGGTGNTPSWDLSGRSVVGVLPLPSYNAQVSGKIVISITVDKSGKVINTEIGRGTTIDNLALRKAAETAALQARFSVSPNAGNQVGSITYHYKLK